MNKKYLLKTPKKSTRFSVLYFALAPLFVIHGVLMVSWAHAQMSPATSISRADSKTHPLELGNPFEMPGPVDKQKTRLIFYRSATSNFKGGSTVYFNGMYHATLSRNAYTSLCVSPGVGTIGIKAVMVGAPSKTSLDSNTAVEMQGGYNQYIRVIEDQNIQVIQTVKEQEALAELTASRAQIHTLSRVVPVQMCNSTADQAAVTNEVAPTPKSTPTPAPVAPKALANVSVQNITLGTDALFAFAGADRKALGAQGHIALDNLIANVKANYSSIERIHVLGYADPIGEAQVNDRLASVRAQTVREYLKENGLQSTLITSEGRGSNALVVATCGRQAQAEDIACNAPNRRVKVVISGVMR
jgi:OOP family OmpA-OmpF porin